MLPKSPAPVTSQGATPAWRNMEAADPTISCKEQPTESTLACSRAAAATLTHHQLWLGQGRLQVVEMQVGVVGQEAYLSALAARQAVQGGLDALSHRLQDARVHGRVGDVYEEDIGGGHRRPHLRQEGRCTPDQKVGAEGDTDSCDQLKGLQVP